MIDEDFGNYNGDNLAECEDDEHDENAYYNWINHPIRKHFDNPKNIFHRSYINNDEEE